MDLFIIKLQDYINIDLKKYFFSKGITVNDFINIRYENSKIILEGNNYLYVLDNDNKVKDQINTIVKNKFDDISLLFMYKIYTYLDIIPKDINIIILYNIIDNGRSYKDFIKTKDFSNIFNNILSSEEDTRKLFYYISPYYSHLQEFPDGLNTWKELFEISYINKYPTPDEDITMYIKGKKLFKPIEGNFFKYYDNNYTIIKNVIKDEDGLPNSFELWFKDGHNFSRDSTYWKLRNENASILITLYRNSSNFAKSNKTTKTNNYSWCKKGVRGGDVKIELLPIIQDQIKILLYTKKDPHLIIPFIGLKIYVIVGLSHKTYEVTNFEYENGSYTKIYCKLVSYIADATNDPLENSILTLILDINKGGYYALEDSDIHDSNISDVGWIFTWYIN